VKGLPEPGYSPPRAPFPRKCGRLTLVVFGGLVLLGSAAVVLDVHRFDRPMLFYYGASPQDVPQGTAIPFFNPLRDRNDERLAEWLIRDLRTNRCEQIVRERLQADPVRICPVVRDTTEASLVWMESRKEGAKWKPSRQLVMTCPSVRQG